MNPATLHAGAASCGSWARPGRSPARSRSRANPPGTDPDPAPPADLPDRLPDPDSSAAPTRSRSRSSITDSHGDALDTNLNAGVDLLKGTASTARRRPSPINATVRPNGRDPRRQDGHLDPQRPRQLPGPGRDRPAQHHPPERPRPRGHPDRARRDDRSSSFIGTSGRPARRPTSPTRSSTTPADARRSRTAARRSSARSSPQQPLSALQRHARPTGPGQLVDRATTRPTPTASAARSIAGR